MAEARSGALVIFGATGDLVFKKIFPALYAMARRGRLQVPVIGVARSPWNVDRFRERARESIEAHGRFDPDVFAILASRLQYIAGEYGAPETFVKLCTALTGVKRPLFYIVLPPSLFATVATGIAKSCCAAEARVVIEKPFGRDLASARELNRTLHQFFPEEAIFRIDHYLGKEPVQNLIYFRFANPLLLAGWSNQHLESVQITMAEKFGVAGRGKFYEEAGAIRDVVQNHLLQVLACLTMDCPKGAGPEALRDQRGRLLQRVRTLDAADVVRGQFRGYRQEPGVDPNSNVETFAAVRFHIDSERWSGVPFYVRAGKCLPLTATEILVRFKPMTHPVLDEAGPPLANYYRFRLSPDELIALGTKIKKPGERMTGVRAELIANHQSPDAMDPYERLLGDAAEGDAALFAREDSVEAAWRIVDPILGDASPVHPYEPETWGPSKCERLLAPPGGWHDPT
jgi:glucose-6-phosphate 1-dehydrogenase